MAVFNYTVWEKEGLKLGLALATDGWNRTPDEIHDVRARLQSNGILTHSQF